MQIVNYTREPLIESIITPKEGCKLLVRNSGGGGKEEYLVDAVEIISFGQALFFRSTESPKQFFVPVSYYEIVEVKETRAVLKTTSLEKSRKINQAKETQQRRSQENKKKKRKALSTKEKKETKEEVKVSSPVEKKLFPPPSTLIKEQLSRFKDENASQEAFLTEEIAEEEKIEPFFEEEKLLEEEEKTELEEKKEE